MLKTYDTSQAAFVERDNAKYYDNTAAAWVEAGSAKTYDTTEQAWVERLYIEWLQLEEKTLNSLDTLEVQPSKIYLDVSAQGYENRNVSFACDAIKTGDIIEFDVIGTYYANIFVGVDCVMVGGGISGRSIYHKDSNTNDVNEHVSIVLTEPDGFSKWGDLRVRISFTHEGLVVGASATIENFKVNGKKYGFTE